MNNIRFCIAILLGLCLLSSCSKDDVIYLSKPHTREVSLIYMLVTNDKGEDLVLKSPDYSVTSKEVETFGFDSWKVFVNEKLLQSSEENITHRRKKVNPYKEENYGGKKIIALESNLAVDNILEKDGYYKKPYTWEYIVTSYSLFGDSEPHRIRINYLPRFETLLHVEVEFAIWVDDIQQTVYYPKGWSLEPNVQEFHVPSFTLNVDRL